MTSLTISQALPFTRWEDLTDDHQTQANQIIDELTQKASCHESNCNSSKSCTSELLNRMSHFAEICPKLSDTKSGENYLLNKKIDEFTNSLKTQETKLLGWQKNVEKYLMTFKKNTPQPQAYEKKLAPIRKGYSNFFKMGLPKIHTDFNSLTKKINKKVAHSPTVEIAKAHLNLITHAHDFSLNYLEENLSDAEKQISDLKQGLDKAIKRKKEFDEMQTTFDRRFSRLEYYIKNNGYSALNELSFKTNYAFGKTISEYKAPPLINPDEEESDETNSESKEPLIISIDDDEEDAHENLLALSLNVQKLNILNAFAQKIDLVKENVFQVYAVDTQDYPPALAMISAWNLCPNQKRKNLDENLNSETSNLNNKIDGIIKEMQTLDTKIETATSINEKIQSINLELENIKNEFIRLNLELQKRISLDTGSTISFIEINHITSILDISNSALLGNISDFQRMTILFRRLQGLLLQNKNAMDVEILKINQELDILNNHYFNKFVQSIWHSENPSKIPLPKKFTDLLLIHKIDSLIKEMSACISDFKNWQAEIETARASGNLRSTDFFKEIEKKYSTFSIGKEKQLLKKRLSTNEEIQQRRKNYENRDTSDPSFQLIANCHDDTSLENLKNNVTDYHQRTREVGRKEKQLSEIETSMLMAEKNFKYAYADFNYALSNETSVTLNRYYPNPDQCTEKFIFLEPLPIDENNEWINKLNKVLTQESIPQNSLRNSILETYIPLHNIEKTKKEKAFNDEIEKFIKLIKHIKSSFDIWKEVWNRASILTANAETKHTDSLLLNCISLTEDQTEDYNSPKRNNKRRSSKGKNEASSTVTSELTILPIEIDYDELRNKSLKEYQEITVSRLDDITSQYIQLKNKLKERKNAGSKQDGVHQISLENIHKAHDIELDELKKNIEIFLKQTLIFEKKREELKREYDFMNISIREFCRFFNYFSYLYQNGFEASASLWGIFNLLYAAGYCNYIETGKLKEPTHEEIKKYELKFYRGKAETENETSFEQPDLLYFSSECESVKNVPSALTDSLPFLGPQDHSTTGNSQSLLTSSHVFGSSPGPYFRNNSETYALGDQEDFMAEHQSWLQSEGLD